MLLHGCKSDVSDVDAADTSDPIYSSFVPLPEDPEATAATAAAAAEVYRVRQARILEVAAARGLVELKHDYLGCLRFFVDPARQVILEVYPYGPAEPEFFRAPPDEEDHVASFNGLVLTGSEPYDGRGPDGTHYLGKGLGYTVPA